MILFMLGLNIDVLTSMFTLLLPLGLVEYVSGSARAKQKTTRYAGGQSKLYK